MKKKSNVFTKSWKKLNMCMAAEFINLHHCPSICIPINIHRLIEDVEHVDAAVAGEGKPQDQHQQ